MGIVGLTANPGGFGGYWAAGNDGGVFSLDGAPYHNSVPGLGISVSNIVAISATASGGGYYLVGNNPVGSPLPTAAAVYAFGDAQFISNGSLNYGAVQGIVANPNPLAGPGYWIFDNTGHVDAYGSCNYFGGLATSNVKALIPRRDGNGYWMITASGAVTPFNTGSIGGFSAATPVVPGQSTPDSGGFVVTDALGNTYAPGDAQFFPGLPAQSITVSSFITGLAMTPDGGGYFMVDYNGDMFAFGDANYFGGV